MHTNQTTGPKRTKTTKNWYKTHGIMTVLTILSCPHTSRHRGYNHHGRPHHLVSPHTSRHRGYSHHLVSATHFTPLKLQSPRPPSDHQHNANTRKHGEPVKEKEKKKKKEKEKREKNNAHKLTLTTHARPCNTRHTNNETKQGISRRPVAVWNTAGYGNTPFLPLPSG